MSRLLALPERLRERSAEENAVTRVILHGDYQEHVVELGYQSCEDTSGQLDRDNCLWIYKTTRSHTVMSGHPPEPAEPTGWRVFAGVLAPGFVSFAADEQYLLGYFDADGEEELYPKFDDCYSKLLADTNPARVDLSIPVFISELRELPRLVYIGGRSIIGGVANANLAYQMGWKPLISDLRKMLDWVGNVDKRLSELKRLTSVAGLKRKSTIELYTEDFTSGTENIWGDPYHFPYNNNFIDMGLVECAYTDRVFSHVWGTVRWIPAEGYDPPQADLARLEEAKQIVAGVHPSQAISTVWEALPWTWLMDWFANLGDFIEATNNTLARPMGSVCLMQKTLFIRHSEVVEYPSWVNIDLTPLQSRVSQKVRYVTSGDPEVVIKSPVLTDRQWSILASLLIQRRSAVGL
nr:MAG: putative maturation protein [Leviviridae sp.]